MKILIDAQPLLGQKTGIGNYTENLIKEINKTNIEIQLITNQTFNFKRLKDIRLSGRGIYLNNKIYPYKAFRRYIPSTLFYSLPIDLLSNKNEKAIFHGTNFISLPTRHAKQIITIHDLAFIKFPNVVEQNIYDYMMRWVLYSIEHADHLIAVSENTKHDIMEYFSFPEENIHVIYSAADARYKKQSDDVVEKVKQKYNLSNKYFLYLGTLEPKKNLLLIIEALAKLKQQHGSQQKLVVVGAKGWKFNPIFERVTELGLENDVIFTGYIPDEDLPAIYSGATAFTFPSFYEGFGIPLLEAMQCEIPVIASNASCIPEVVGDGGILLDPNDVDGWTKVMHEISTNIQLREEYVRKGLNQASKFSWEETAIQTIEVYKKAIQG